MGTKVEYSINLLAARATSVDWNNSSSVKGMHVWEHYQSSEGHRIVNNYNLQFPMERRVLDRNIVESIKKTMQMHEDIFKHQVQELHRVYSVQKKLMDELKKENRQKKEPWTPMINGPGTSQSQSQAHDTNHHYGAADFQAQSSRERSSGSCCEEQYTVTKIARGFDLEMPAEEEGTSNGCDEGEAGPGPRSYTAFAFQSGSDEEMEVDLTLSIGGGSNKAKKKKIQWHVGESGFSESPRKLDLLCASFKSDRVGVGECSDPTTPMSSSSVTFEQERKEPQYWLSQGLKLK